MRALLCGGAALADAARALGLEPSQEDPQVAIVDLREPDALAAAALIPHGVPRVIVADANGRALARALGWSDDAIADSCEPAFLGPLIEAAVPGAARAPTRVVVVTAARGGVGRTLLVANVAVRLARRLRVLALDATGTGAAAWWLGANARPWSELEALAGELTPDHLALVAGDAGKVRIIGGPPLAPSATLVSAATRVVLGLADVLLVDAPLLADERTRALVRLADRVLVLAYSDPASRAALEGAEVPEDAWLIASQSLGDSPVDRAFRALPRDEGAVAGALAGPGPVRGALGRAYDEIAAIIAADAR